jgi:hypothetical protein
MKFFHALFIDLTLHLKLRIDGVVVGGGGTGFARRTAR